MSHIITHRDKTPHVAPGAWVAPTATLIGDVAVGAESSVWFGAVLRGDLMPIRVGARTSIQDNSVLHTTHGLIACSVGDDCTVGHAVVLHGCTIRDRVLVGMGSVVLDEAEIGPDVLLGAGSLVTAGTRIPSGVLAHGRPARAVRDLRPDELARVHESAALYVGYRADYLADLLK